MEPIPELARRLRECAEGLNIKVIRTALGSHPGTGTLGVTSASQFSSLLDSAGTEDDQLNGENTVIERISVPISTIEEVLESHQTYPGPRVYLKLDTQGFDLEVLAGLSEQRGRVVALQSELALRPIYRGARPRQVACGHTGSGVYCDRSFPHFGKPVSATARVGLLFCTYLKVDVQDSQALIQVSS